MSAPSPFAVGQAIGTNMSQSFNRARDESTIDSILSNAMQTESPEELQRSIGMILSKVSPERQGPAMQYIQGMYENIQSKKQKALQDEAARSAGVSPNLPPALQVQQMKDRAKNQRIANVQGFGGDTGGYGQSGAHQPNQMMGQPGIPPENNQQEYKPLQSWLERKSIAELKTLAGHPDREVSEPVKLELDARQKQEEIERKGKAEERKFQHEYHKESQAFDEEIEKNTRIAKKQFKAIEDIDEAVNSGNVSPLSMSNIFKGLGTWGDKISEAMLSGDQAKLQANIPQLLEGWKEVFGVRLTDADLRILQDKLPSMGKNKAANTAITKVLRKYADVTLLRGQIASDIKKQNKGLRPLGFASLVETRFDEMMTPVKIVNPANGKVIEIPAYKVGDAMKNGGVLYQEPQIQGA